VNERASELLTMIGEYLCEGSHSDILTFLSSSSHTHLLFREIINLISIGSVREKKDHLVAGDATHFDEVTVKLINF
jgi:hypothetical protein